MDVAQIVLYLLHFCGLEFHADVGVSGFLEFSDPHEGVLVVDN